MAINVRCPSCGAQFRRPAGLVGKSERCPECRTVFRIVAVPEEKPSVQRPAPAPTAQKPPSLVKGPSPAKRVAASQPLPEKASAQAPQPAKDDKKAAAPKPAAAPVAKASPSVEKPVAAKTPAPVPPKKVLPQKPKQATAEPPEKYFRPAMAAAMVVCAGKTGTAAEFELIKQGMTQSRARELIDYMHASYERHMEQRKQKRTSMWMSLVGGLGILLTCLPGSFSKAAVDSPTLKTTAFAFAGVGAILFAVGLRRFLGGPKPVSAKDMAAEWEAEHDE